MNKSYVVVFLLTLLFGPLGLFYCSTASALGLIIAALVFGSITGGVGALVVWFFSIIVGMLCVDRHNNHVALDEERHQELLEATNKASANYSGELVEHSNPGLSAKSRRQQKKGLIDEAVDYYLGEHKS